MPGPIGAIAMLVGGIALGAAAAAAKTAGDELEKNGARPGPSVPPEALAPRSDTRVDLAMPEMFVHRMASNTGSRIVVRGTVDDGAVIERLKRIAGDVEVNDMRRRFDADVVDDLLSRRM